MWPERKPGARDCGLVNVIVLCLDDEARETIANLFNPLPVRTFITNSGSHANRILNDVPCRPIVTDRLLPPWPGLAPLPPWVGGTHFLPRPLARPSLGKAPDTAG